MITLSLSHLLDRGLRLDASEALAITQLLIVGGNAPRLEGIQLTSGGSVLGIAGRADVAGYAALLDTLLPAQGVPAPLRYAVERGVGRVEAPPFASVDAFSAALARFERGERDGVVRQLLARAKPQPAVPLAPVIVIPEVVTPEVLAPEVVAPIVVARGRGRERAAAVAAALFVCALAGFAGGEMLRRTSRAADSPVAAHAPVTPHASVSAQAPAVVPTSGHVVGNAKPTSPASPSTPRVTAPPVSLRPATPEPVLPREDTPAYSPAFSNTGTAMFFQTGGPKDPTSAIAVASSERGPDGDLRIMTVVDDGSRNYHAQPSPDGRYIAFDSDRDGERGVYVADRDGHHVRRVSGPGYAALPTWSPDGQRLSYVRAEAGHPSVWNLWLQPLNGGSAVQLTSYRTGQTWNASWFPDNRRVAYSHEDRLYVLDVVSGAERSYRTPVAGRLVRTPAVSPDGSKIVFQVFRAGAWVLDLRDGSMVCVLADPTAEEFAWAPDGRRLAFHSRRDGQWGVYVLARG